MPLSPPSKLAKHGCLSSPEQVLVGIGYRIGRLIAGVVHGRVAVNGREGVPVHEGHLGAGGLRKMFGFIGKAGK